MGEPEEPHWITYEQAVAIHSRQLRRFGGAPGLRDEGMLRSALERPVNKWRYEQAPLDELAAAYAFGLAKNHAFVDGNKRTGWLAAELFLVLNGYRFLCDDATLVLSVERLAAGNTTQEQFAAWIREHLEESRTRK